MRVCDREPGIDQALKFGEFKKRLRSVCWSGPGFWGGMGCCWTRKSTREEPPGSRENLRKALRELNYIGIAAEIGRKQTELMTPFLSQVYFYTSPDISLKGHWPIGVRIRRFLYARK